MRLPIWKKNDFFNMAGKRLDMDPAIVEIDKTELHLNFMFHHDELPIGRVTNIVFEDGEILGDVELFEKSTYTEDVLFNKMEDGGLGCRLGGFYNNVNEKDGQVLTATLRGVSVVIPDAVPRLKT